MEKEQLQLTIKKEDKYLYDFFKHCETEEQLKSCLETVVELYKIATGNYEITVGCKSPEYLKEQIKDKSVEELQNLKKEYQKEILEYATWFEPELFDCGVMIGPEPEYWFVEEDGGPLGWITLYSRYIEVVDELLKKKEGVNEIR